MANQTFNNFDHCYEFIKDAMSAAWPGALVIDAPLAAEPTLPYSIILHESTTRDPDADGGTHVGQRHTFLLIRVMEWEEDAIAARVRETKLLASEIFTGPTISSWGFRPDLEEVAPGPDESPEDRKLTVGMRLSFSTIGAHF